MDETNEEKASCDPANPCFHPMGTDDPEDLVDTATGFQEFSREDATRYELHVHDTGS